MSSECCRIKKIALVLLPICAVHKKFTCDGLFVLNIFPAVLMSFNCCLYESFIISCQRESEAPMS